LKKVGNKEFRKIAWIVIISISALTALFAYKATQVKFNYNFEEFFPANDPESDFFYEHRQRFESDNDFILVAIEKKAGIFDSTFLNKVHDLSSKIDALDLVQYTRDITKEKEVFVNINGTTFERPYIHLDSLQLEQDSLNIYENKELVNALINKKGTALSLIVRHQDFLSKAKSDFLVGKVKSLVDAQNFEDVRYAGRAIGQKYYIDTMSQEMIFFIGLSIFLIVGFLFISFKSIWGVIIPQIVIVLSLVWILGVMVLLNEPINILLTILPSIMFVVGMSDVIHLVSKYIELLRNGVSKLEAIKTSFKEIGMATFLTSVTTSIGFFTLLLVNVKPIQKFGLAVGIGVLIAFVLTFTLLPVLFYFSPKPKITKKVNAGKFWVNNMRKAFLFTLKNKKSLLAASVLVIGVFSYGTSLIVQDNFLMDDLKDSAEIKKDFDSLDAEFGGVRPFELAIKVKDLEKDVWDVDILKDLEKVEKYLTSTYGVTMKASIPFYISVLNRSFHSGDTNYFEVPDKKSKIRKLKRPLKMANDGSLLRTVLDSTERNTRISGTIPDWGNVRVTKKNKAFEAFLNTEIDTTQLDIKLTSTAHLLDKNMSYMSGSLVQGLALATLIVAVIMGLLYKSFSIVILSIIPNLIPLIIIGGVMGFFGINLKITTAIVFTIAFGIAVDDTIHFLSKFKLELNKGKSKLYALKSTFISTGRAIVLTSVILCSGFLMLIFSDFLGTFYMGLMISLTLIFAVVADLFLLPILLILFYNPKKKKVL